MSAQNSSQRSDSKKSGINIIIGVCFCTLSITRIFFQSRTLSGARLTVAIIEGVFGLLLILAGSAFFGAMGSMGVVQHEQVFDLNIEKRVRERYASELQQLSDLGFKYAFLEGESFSIYRIFLIFPAIVLLMMLAHREVSSIRTPGRILNTMPIFSSPDGRTFGHPFGLGVKFQTAFRNGLILVTKNFGNDSCESPEFVVQSAKRTVLETWQAHQVWLSKLDTELNPANRDSSYQAYVTISRRESDLLKKMP